MNSTKIATKVSLGHETFIWRESPAVNSHSANFELVECLLNTVSFSTTEEEQQEAYYQGSERRIENTYTEYFVDCDKQNKISCYAVVGNDNFDFSYDNSQSYEKPILYWLFPNRSKWVPLGFKRSYELLKENEGTIPSWLEEKVRGYKTSGDGWAVIN